MCKSFLLTCSDVIIPPLRPTGELETKMKHSVKSNINPELSSDSRLIGGSLIALECGTSGRIAMISLCLCSKEGEGLWAGSVGSDVSGGGWTVSSSADVHVLHETK